MTTEGKKGVTREELYDLVWRLSLKKVGEKYNVSEAEIRKNCKSFNIPLPDNSYRGRSNSGQNPERRLLPKMEEEIIITFNDKQRQIIYPHKDFAYLEESLANKANEIYKSIDNAEKKIPNHKLVIAYKQEMIERKHYLNQNNNWTNYIPRNKKPILDLGNLTKSNLIRAFSICNKLFQAIEEMGGTITVELDKPSVINIRGVRIGFRIREKCNRIYTQQGDKNNNLYRTSELVPNGKLAFQYSSYGYHYYDRQIVDTDSVKIEDKINIIFKRIIDFSQEEIERKIAREERDRIYEIRRLEKERTEKLRDQEIKKVQLLLQNLTLWEKAESLRRYINILEYSLTEQFNNIKKEYIEWARKKADWIDPTLNKKDDILDEIMFEKELMKMMILEVED